MKNKLSLVLLICTHNYRKSIFLCLKSIKFQTQKPDHIVFVEKTKKIGFFNKNKLSKYFNNSIKITYKHIKNSNISTSRNLALKYATEDIILYIDDDVILEKNYLKTLLFLYKKNPEIDSIVGKIIPTKFTYWQIFINRLYTAELFDQNKKQTVLQWPTMNFSIRKKILDFHNLKYNEKYSAAEDIDFCLRLRKNGYKIYYFPELRIKHHYKDSIRTFVNSYSIYFYKNIKYLSEDHPEYNIFPIKMFYIKSSSKIIYYAKLSKKIIIESNHLRKNLRLSFKYYFASLIYYLIILRIHLGWKPKKYIFD